MSGRRQCLVCRNSTSSAAPSSHIRLRQALPDTFLNGSGFCRKCRKDRNLVALLKVLTELLVHGFANDASQFRTALESSSLGVCSRCFIPGITGEQMAGEVSDALCALCRKTDTRGRALNVSCARLDFRDDFRPARESLLSVETGQRQCCRCRASSDEKVQMLLARTRLRNDVNGRAQSRADCETNDELNAAEESKGDRAESDELQEAAQGSDEVSQCCHWKPGSYD
eukprot:scaffold2971_cov274-Pinguiococcus_pyrenoidosus.AAC.2